MIFYFFQESDYIRQQENTTPEAQVDIAKEKSRIKDQILLEIKSITKPKYMCSTPEKVRTHTSGFGVRKGFLNEKVSTGKMGDLILISILLGPGQKWLRETGM